MSKYQNNIAIQYIKRTIALTVLIVLPFISIFAVENTNIENGRDLFDDINYRFALPNCKILYDNNSNSGLYLLNSSIPINIKIDGISLMSKWNGDIDISGLPSNFHTGYSYDTKSLSLDLINTVPNKGAEHEIKVEINTKRLSISSNLMSMVNDNLYYFLGANYWRGDKGVLSKNIPTEYQYSKHTLANTEYQSISTMGKIGIRDKISDISLLYLLLNNQRAIPTPLTQETISGRNKDNLSQLINLKYNTKLTYKSSLFGNLYYKNMQKEYLNANIGNYENINLNQKSSEIGGDIKFHTKTSKHENDIGLRYEQTTLNNYFTSFEDIFKISDLYTFIEHKYKINEKSFLNGGISHKYQYSNKNDSSSIYNSSFGFDLRYNISIGESGLGDFSIGIARTSLPFFLASLYQNDSQTNKRYLTQTLFDTEIDVPLASKIINDLSLSIGLGEFENTMEEKNYFTRANLKSDINVIKNWVNLGVNASYYSFSKTNIENIYIPNISTNICLYNPKRDKVNYHWELMLIYENNIEESINFQYQKKVLVNARITYAIWQNLIIGIEGNNILDYYHELYPGIPESGQYFGFTLRFLPKTI